MSGTWLAMLVVGVIFLLVGVGGMLWGRREANQDYNILISHADAHTDIKKLVGNRWRVNSGAGALMMGGIVSIILGLFLLALVAFHFYRG